ncbi:MAG: hypothetical protein CVU68_01160 [Deltaproteobacteria bacterium HGW-Deltaproteobacteria-3]|nr:MAG: hypothetical protein CVU68_01160 [Deltaproteobacteria bacterium HGW-Deltaproteobacteria-3]
MIISKTEKYGRVLAIGDIHGCARHLEKLLEAIEPTCEDLIVTLGDYIDRGPDSKGVIDILIDLHSNQDINIVSLRGNHDAMLLMCFDQARLREYYPSKAGLDADDVDYWERVLVNSYPGGLWYSNEALETFISYGDRRGKASRWLEVQQDLNWFYFECCNDITKQMRELTIEVIPQEHIDFLRNSCVDACETDKFIFVHGGLCPDIPLADQPLFPLHWKRFNKDCKPHCSGRKVICGHTPQPDLLVHDLGHAACLDTGAYMEKGFLTCMDVMNGQCWQIDDDLQLIQQPVVHYGDKMPFVRISELPDGDRQEFKSWLMSRSAPWPTGEKKDNCAWPNDYRYWWRGKR